MNRFVQYLKCIAVSLALLVTSQVLANPAIDRQIRTSAEAFKSGNIVQIKKASSELAWSGISSPRVYDHAEKRALESYMATDKPGVQLAGHLIKALGYSGNKKYAATLEKIQDDAAHKKVRGYAKKALLSLEQHARWNPQISAGLGALNSSQLDQQRVLNMLASTDYELVRIGAKRVNHAHRDNPRLQQAVKDRLLREYQKDSDDKIFIDTIAWMVRALANSGDPAYRSTLEEVAEKSPHRKISKRAAKYAATL